MKTNARLSSIWSYEHDLEMYSPDDANDFGLLINFSVGFSGAQGVNDFSFFVCTPAYIEKDLQKKSCVWGRHLLLVKTYSYDGIKNSIELMIKNLDADENQHMMEKISRFAAWEYEDYKINPKHTKDSN